MYDEKEIEELYDEFLRLDGDMFLESDVDMTKLDNDIVSGKFDASAAQIPSNLKNNNFLSESGGCRMDKPDVSIQLDLLNQNFISLNTHDFDRGSKSPTGFSEIRTAGHALARPSVVLDRKVNEVDNELKEIDEKLSSPLSPVENHSFHRAGWTPDALGLWHSGPSSLNLNQHAHSASSHQDLSSSVSYTSHGPQSLGSFSSSAKRTYSHQQLGAKVEMVYSLLSMLDTDNREDMSKTFLAMSSSPESCHAMRQSGCLPLLIQLIYSSELDKEVRNRAAEALHNVVHAQTDEKRRKREVRVLKLLHQVREYCDELKYTPQTESQESDKHPINATGTLMKLSFDAEHRHAICILGGLHAITDLIQVDHKVHGSTNDDTLCITMRRYSGMSLTNLTFGDGKNKALLCSFGKFLLALVDQLKSPSEDLRQVTASVLRNLSWRADSDSKSALRQVGAVTALTVSAMEAKKESTLKSILSALWNLSAHCSLNKIDICSVPGALAFLVKMLKYKSASNTLSIIENAGGILRNISSHIAVREDYRQILRDNCCFEVLLEQLKSPSLTVVSNACGTLWNLSARCQEDQRRLWEMGATTMLRSLVQSKHKMIAMGSSAALKNLLAANPNENLLSHLDSTAKSLGLQNLPTLFVRKKRALEQELNITLAETCENIEPVAPSPTHINKTEVQSEEKRVEGPKRSDSHDSLKSSKSDTVYELLNQISHASKVLDSSGATLHTSLDEKLMNRRSEDHKLLKKYATSMIPTPTFKKMNQDRINEKTKEEKRSLDEVEEALPESETKEQTKTDPKQRIKKGIPVLKNKPKRNTFLDNSQQERSSSKLQEEASLRENNYFLEGENISENQNDFGHSQKKLSNVECRKNAVERSESGSEVASLKAEGVTLSRGTTFTRGGVKSANVFAKTNEVQRERSLDNVKTPNKIEKVEKENSQDYLNDTLRRSYFEIDENERPLSTGGTLEVKQPLKADVAPEKNVPTLRRNLSRESSPLQGSTVSGIDAKNDQMEKLDFNYGEVSQSGFECLEVNNNSPRACERLLQKPRTLEELKMSSKEPTMSTGVFAPFAPFSDVELPGSFSSASSAASDAGNRRFPDKTEPAFELKEQTEDHLSSSPPFKAENVTADSSASLVPKFKVGSPITDRKILQMEARKLCREIQKDHDFEMGCSLTSEVSLVSCSSFLDTGDYSLFDCSTDTVNFDDSETIKPTPKVKNNFFLKSLSQAAETVSLPSLGSLKNEQIEALDLDNSVLSVASITSEVDENYANDHAPSASCTGTYKIGAREEFPEDTSADVTLISKADDTLNAEFLDDDSSLHSQENLPLDVDSLPVATSDQVRTRLTPKEKRKTFQERYRTYTIRDFKPTGRTGLAPIIGDQEKNDVELAEAPSEVSPHVASGCGQYDLAWGTDHGSGHAVERTRAEDIPSKTVHRGRGNDTIHFSKSFDRERDCMPPFLCDSKSLNDLLSIGPSERKELVDNAKLVAFSLKTAVQDWETEFIWDSETDEPHKSSDIDTATYTKSFRGRTQSRLSLQEFQVLQSSEDPYVENLEKCGAKITKPSEKEENEAAEESKGIRGRRKPLYVSPHKSPLRIRSTSTAKVTPEQAVVEPKRFSLQQTCQSPPLHREGTFTKEDGKSSGTATVQSKNFESKNATRLPSKSRFIPSAGNSKGESRISRIGRPLSTYSSRANEKRVDSESSQRRPFSAGAGNRTAGESVGAAKKPASPMSPKMRSSSSSQNVKAGTASLKFRNLNAQSGKSQSDASLNLVDAKDKAFAGKGKPSKKEVTSKIATLWRKVEETKEKNKNLKDNRVWIGPEQTRASGEASVMEKEEIVHIPTRTIVHSYTCQALADGTCNDYASHESGIMDERRNHKRTVISAVVPPYNYNPPVPAVTSTNLKNVDNYQKSSLKITTV